MFGSLTTLLAISGLAMLSAGSLAYVILYGRITNENRVEQRLGQIQARKAGIDPARVRDVDPTARRKSVQETLRELDKKQKAKAKNSKAPPLSLRLQQAGLTWTRRTFFIFSAICGLVAFALAWVLGAPYYVCIALAIAGLLGFPRWIVNFLRKRRIKKFLDEFPNAVDIIVRGVKAGLPLNDCIRVIASEALEPVRSEFRGITEAQSLGLPLADAVARLPERVPVPEANFFAILITIQQKGGGNLSEALGNLSRVLRERKKMKGKIKAMSMEAKASATIIGALPVVVGILVYLTSPAYIAVLFSERLGNVILGASAIWMLLGVLVMRRMINFDF
jgi:tight adherence protein B